MEILVSSKTFIRYAKKSCFLITWFGRVYMGTFPTGLRRIMDKLFFNIFPVSYFSRFLFLSTVFWNSVFRFFFVILCLVQWLSPFLTGCMLFFKLVFNHYSWCYSKGFVSLVKVSCLFLQGCGGGGGGGCNTNKSWIPINPPGILEILHRINLNLTANLI